MSAPALQRNTAAGVRGQALLDKFSRLIHERIFSLHYAPPVK